MAALFDLLPMLCVFHFLHVLEFGVWFVCMLFVQVVPVPLGRSRPWSERIEASRVSSCVSPWDPWQRVQCSLGQRQAPLWLRPLPVARRLQVSQTAKPIPHEAGRVLCVFVHQNQKRTAGASWPTHVLSPRSLCAVGPHLRAKGLPV